MKKFNKVAICTLLALSTSYSVLAAEPAQEVISRSANYVDNTRNDYLSDWKAMITNSMPDQLLENGRWFEKSANPRPFKMSQNPKEFSPELRKKIVSNSTDGLIVVKDGEMVQQYFRYGFGIDDIHLVHSTGKVFTSMAIQPIYDEIGVKGLDRKLEHYIPELKGKFFGDATVKEALDMKVGMSWTENYDDPTSATMLSGPVGGWDPTDLNESWHERMFDFPKYGEHGKTWVYSSASVMSVSFAAENISEQPFSKLVQESYDRMGFEDRSWYVENKLQELSAEGGQAITIRDHAKMGRFMLETKDSQYVNDVWENAADPKDSADATFLAKYGEAFGVDGYNNYWYRINQNEILALGSSGQFLYVNKAKNLIISKYSSFVGGQNVDEFMDALSIIREIAKSY